MRIGLVYDLRNDYLAQGFSVEAVAEFDSEETISSIQNTIESLGYEVQRIGNTKKLCEQLAAGQRWDMVFNIAEGLGGRCRESQAPAILELYKIPYTFSDPFVCALTLDKAMAKRIVASNGLPTPRFAVITQTSDITGLNLDYPLFAKPLAEGTGKGIDASSRISGKKELINVCSRLLEQHKQPVLVEEFLPGREFTVGILGSGGNARVLGVMEIEFTVKDEPAIYSFINKEECETRIVYHPALKNDTITKKGSDLALKCYRALECNDAGRIDIRCDSAGQPCFMELNPLPGLHPTHSDLPMIATQEGITYTELIKTILENAFARYC